MAICFRYYSQKKLETYIMQNMILVSSGDAITARLVEEAGFNGIWVSGFEASARLGLTDNGSITMTEMLNVAKPIVDAVKIPVYVDVDTGYGNFARTVREFEKIGVTGICVQDDIPHLKTNSLWGGKAPLMDMKEFAKKINIKPRKIKIIARTEALIRGYGHDEAFKRLDMYKQYGADILLPHVRKSVDMFAGMQNKAGRHKAEIPYAIVPTKFPHYTNEQLFNKGYSMVIWANTTERVKIKAIRDSLKILKKDDSAINIENKLSASLDDMRNLTPHE